MEATTATHVVEHDLHIDPALLSVHDRTVEGIDPTVMCPVCEKTLDGAECTTTEYALQTGPGWYDLRIRATVECDCGAEVHLHADADDCDPPTRD